MQTPNSLGMTGILEPPGFFVVVWENDFSAAAPTCPLLFQSGERAAIYFLAPHRLRGGRGPRSGEGGFADGTLPQETIKMALHTSKGRHLHLPFTIFHLPLTIFSGPPSTTIVVPLPPSSGGRQNFEKMESRHYATCPPPLWGWVASGARRKGAAI